MIFHLDSRLTVICDGSMELPKGTNPDQTTGLCAVCDGWMVLIDGRLKTHKGREGVPALGTKSETAENDPNRARVHGRFISIGSMIEGMPGTVVYLASTHRWAFTDVSTFDGADHYTRICHYRHETDSHPLYKKGSFRPLFYKKGSLVSLA